MIPKHVAIIIDGNRRWARQKGLPTLRGHQKGLAKLKKIAKGAFDRGVKRVTIYAFSTENWNRSKAEVNYLMKLLQRSLSEKKLSEFQREGIKIKIAGQRERLPETLQQIIKKAEEITKAGDKIMTLCISYGGKNEILNSLKKIIKKGLPADKITEQTVAESLEIKEEPDLIIRSGGEKRLSNFLIWQSTYSELYFIKKYWPSFTEKDLDEALEEYSSRQRRFGK